MLIIIDNHERSGIFEVEFSFKESLRRLFKDMWNVPNALTILRILLIPVFVVLFFSGETEAEIATARYWSLGVFLLASFTDMLDGKIARKNHLVTDFGKFLDPLADKMLVNSAFVCFAVLGEVPVVFPIISPIANPATRAPALMIIVVCVSAIADAVFEFALSVWVIPSRWSISCAMTLARYPFAVNVHFSPFLS